MLACCPGGLRDLKSGALAVNETKAKSPRRPGLRRRGFFHGKRYLRKRRISRIFRRVAGW